jgi:hypothetical protein
MQLFQNLDAGNAYAVGLGIKVLVLTSPQAGSSLSRRIASLGGQIEVLHELFAGLEAIIDDPAGYGLLVIDCDDMGGIETVRKSVTLLASTGRRFPVLLFSNEVALHSFPEDSAVPTTLRAPVSTVSLRVGFEHALRDRLAFRSI